jgi:hypothetical protein
MEKTPESESFEKYKLLCENMERTSRSALEVGKKLLAKWDVSQLEDGWRERASVGKFLTGESIAISLGGMFIMWSRDFERKDIQIIVRLREDDRAFRIENTMSWIMKIG